MIMSNYDHRFSFFCHTLEHGGYLFHVLKIESACRLVKNKYLTLRSNCNTLFLTTGKGHGMAIRIIGKVKIRHYGKTMLCPVVVFQEGSLLLHFL